MAARPPEETGFFLDHWFSYSLGPALALGPAAVREQCQMDHPLGTNRFLSHTFSLPLNNPQLVFQQLLPAASSPPPQDALLDSNIRPPLSSGRNAAHQRGGTMGLASAPHVHMPPLSKSSLSRYLFNLSTFPPLSFTSLPSSLLLPLIFNPPDISTSFPSRTPHNRPAPPLPKCQYIPESQTLIPENPQPLP